MNEHGYAFVSGDHAFELAGENAKPQAGAEIPMTVFARFPTGPLLASGLAVGEEKMRGKAVGVEATVGRGHVILFGFNVQNRAQSYATHKLLYNAVLGATVTAAPDGVRDPPIRQVSARAPRTAIAVTQRVPAHRLRAGRHRGLREHIHGGTHRATPRRRARVEAGRRSSAGQVALPARA